MKINKINRLFGQSIGIIIFVLLTVFSISCKKKLEKITTNAIFVANEDDGTVSILNANNLTIIGKINLEDKAVLPKNKKMIMPHNIQVAPNGKTVWVTGMPMDEEDENQIIVIDANKRKIKERILVGKGHHVAHVVLDNECRYAYVTANESNLVLKINVDKLKVDSYYDLGHGHKPHGLRFFNGKLYVANMDAKSMSIIDVNSGQIDEIALGGIAVQTAVTPDGKYVYVSLFDTKEVARVELGTMAVVKIPLPSESQGPIQLYATPNSKLVYVCDQGGLLGRPLSDKVYVIDVMSSAVVNTIVTGNKAHGVVIDEMGTNAFITNSEDNTVSVIDIATQSVIKTIGVGKNPNGISCWHNYAGTSGGKP